MSWLGGQLVDDLAVSAVTILELERGVQQKERTDPKGAMPLRRWLGDIVWPTFSERILPIDAEVATAAASLHVPNPMPEMDALIAATAQVHDLTLVTRNTRDFERVKLRLLNPWDL